MSDTVVFGMRSAIIAILGATLWMAASAASPFGTVVAQTTAAPAPQLAPSTNPQVEALLQGAAKLRWSNRVAEADREFQAAVTLAEKITDPVQRGELPRALDWQQSFFRDQKRYAEALAAGERSLRLYEERFGKNDLRVGELQLHLANTHTAAFNFSKAEPYLRQVLAAYDRDQSPERRPQASSAALGMANALYRQGKMVDAIDFQRKGIEIAKKATPPNGVVVSGAYVGLGRYCEEQKEPAAAGAAYEEAVKAAETATGDQQLPTLSNALLAQAVWLGRERRNDQARAAAQRALVLRQQVFGFDSAGARQAREVLDRVSSGIPDTLAVERAYQVARDAYAKNPHVGTGRAAADALLAVAKQQRDTNRLHQAETSVWESIKLREAAAANDFGDLAVGYAELADLRLRQGRAVEAEPAFKKAIELFGKQGKFDGTDIASIYVRLGDAQVVAGRYREAAASQQRAILALPPAYDPLIFAIYQLRLAQTFTVLRRFDEAEAMARRALAAREGKLGTDDVLVGDAVYSVSTILSSQSRYADAEPLYRRALEIHARAHGEASPYALADRFGLALTVEGLGRVVEAESMLRQLLGDQERALGPSHAAVAETIVSLVWNLRRQGRLVEAAAIADKPLKIQVAALGPDHPGIVSGIVMLATIHQDRSEFDQADKLLRDALRIRVKAYGSESIPVADLYGGLVSLSLARRQFDQAADFAAKRLRISEKVYGLDGWQLIGPLGDMQYLKGFGGDVNEVNVLARRVLSIAERHFGKDSLIVAAASMDVAYSFRMRGMFGDVVDYYLRPLAIYTKRLGPRHPRVAEALILAAAVQVAVGKAKDAEASYDEAASILAEAYGKDSPALSGPLVSKALLLYQLRRFDEAEALLKQSAELLQKGAGKPTVALATVLLNLSFVYEDRGKKAEADRLRQEAVSIFASLYGPGRLPPLIPAPILPQRTRET